MSDLLAIQEGASNFRPCETRLELRTIWGNYGSSIVEPRDIKSCDITSRKGKTRGGHRLDKPRHNAALRINLPQDQDESNAASANKLLFFESHVGEQAWPWLGINCRFPYRFPYRVDLCKSPSLSTITCAIMGTQL
jgi:hypothetical protein